MFRARIVEKGENGEMLLEFEVSGAELDGAIAIVGHMPLPPYIALKRGEDAQDEKDYQTIYAREEGAVAAPTAGLHFTENLMKEIKSRGVEEHFVTLHVGAGTFLPVKVDDTDHHKMHSEIGNIAQQTDEQGNLKEWSGSTDIFITPGYKFKFVDRLMTNFHLPRSTLFMLVSAFNGLDNMRNAYHHAIETGYRFYSYGDTSLLERKD